MSDIFVSRTLGKSPGRKDAEGFEWMKIKNSDGFLLKFKGDLFWYFLMYRGASCTLLDFGFLQGDSGEWSAVFGCPCVTLLAGALHFLLGYAQQSAGNWPDEVLSISLENVDAQQSAGNWAAGDFLECFGKYGSSARCEQFASRSFPRLF